MRILPTPVSHASIQQLQRLIANSSSAENMHGIFFSETDDELIITNPILNSHFKSLKMRESFALLLVISARVVPSSYGSLCQVGTFQSQRRVEREPGSERKTA